MPRMTTTLEHPANRPSPDSPDPSPKRWRLRTKVLIGVGTTVVVVGGIGVLDYAVSETQHETRVFHEQVTALDTDLSSGSLRVVGGDTSDVTVEMTVHSGVQSPSHSETVVNGRLLLRSACDFGFTTDNCSVDYVIHAPAGVAVSAHGDGGNIDLVSMAGDADVSVNGGRVRLNFSEAPHHVKARANGGEIVVAVPDDGQAYRVDSDTSGGSSSVDVRTDPASDHVIDAHVNGGSVVVEYTD